VSAYFKNDPTNGRVNTTYSPFGVGAAMTFEGWALRRNVNLAHSILSGDGATAPQLALSTSDTTVLWNPNRSGSSGNLLQPNTAGYPSAVWRHFAVTFDDTAHTAEWFQDGESIQAATTGMRALGATPGNLVFGTLPAGEPFTGRLAHLAVYPTVLSAAAIRSHADYPGEREWRLNGTTWVPVAA
jgi:hypothetical protein